jgi:transcriptional regulator with XRE-family HTH domain
VRQSKFSKLLEHEFQRGKEKNAKYSLRAFAAFLRTDHSPLSQILRDKRNPSQEQIENWCKRLGISTAERQIYGALERLPDAATLRQQEQLRHWTAEGLLLISKPVHLGILQLLRRPEFHSDVRWIAKQLGTNADEVNDAVSRLLRLRLLELRNNQWKDLTGKEKLTETIFRNLALKAVAMMHARLEEANSIEEQ